jgi:hypothetical protein
MPTFPFCNRCRSAIREEHGRATGRCLSCCEIETCAACAAKETNDCTSDRLACCDDEGCASPDPDCCDAKVEED